MGMNGGIIVHRELRALIAREYALHSLFILFPASVFQRSDVKEDMRSAGIEFGGIGRVEGGPRVPYFLQVSFVRSGRSGFLRGRFREAAYGDCEQEQQNGGKTLHGCGSLQVRRNFRTSHAI